MGHGADKQTMPKIAAALVVLILALEAPSNSFARSSVTPRRSLLYSTNKPRMIAVDLMHVQHVDSPYRQPNLTVMERAQISAANSKRRLNNFERKFSGKQTASVFTSPLAPTQSEYIMQITVGTPARTFVAIADTGSDLIWLQCTCTNCLQTPDPPFDPIASSSYTGVPCTANPCIELYSNEIPCSSNNLCGYNYSYGDASFTYGEMAYETFTLTSTDGSTTPISNVAFGCGTDDESTTFMKTDGLVGLGWGPLSLVSQLGPYIGSVFSYCLVDYTAAFTQTSALVLGSPGAAPKVYTPLVFNSFFPSFYYVNLVGITVNGNQVTLPSDVFTIDRQGNGGIFLDSGTSVTHLVDAAFIPFANAIAAVISYPVVNTNSPVFELCYDTSAVSSPVFPSVVFQFENVDLTLPTSNTFWPFDNQLNQGTYCLAFTSTSGGFSIFGNYQQQTIGIAYDTANKQVGFATTLGC